jgi:hypothetical protein
MPLTVPATPSSCLVGPGICLSVQAPVALPDRSAIRTLVLQLAHGFVHCAGTGWLNSDFVIPWLQFNFVHNMHSQRMLKQKKILFDYIFFVNPEIFSFSPMNLNFVLKFPLAID